jgi:hypothetical protein
MFQVGATGTEEEEEEDTSLNFPFICVLIFCVLDLNFV